MKKDLKDLKDFSAGAESVSSVSADTTDTSTTKSRKPGFRNLAITLIGSLTVYAVIFFSLNLWAGVSFGWSIFLGYAVGLAVFAYLDSVFKSTSENGWPIFLLMTIILIMSLAVHYLPDEKIDNSSVGSGNCDNIEIVVGPENGNVSHVGERWETINNFQAGQHVDVKISNGSVRLNKSNTLLKPGLYTIPILSDGSLVFRGISNTSVDIEVIY